MKIVKLILITALFFSSLNIFADNVDIVTLTTTGEGKTKDEATTNALRSAIEQAFGAFISSKTEIMNDELISDKIVSVSNGNIKKYEIVSSQQLTNGTVVTVKSQVSLSKLSTFCKNNGASVEFDGAAFGANIKLQNLYERNEIEVINQLSTPFLELSKHAFDYKITAKDPIMTGYMQNEVKSRESAAERAYRMNKNEIKNDKSEKWEVPLTITASANSNFFNAVDLLYNTLSSVSLSKSEVESYVKFGKPVYPFSFCSFGKEYQIFYLRSEQTINQVISLIGNFEKT